MPLIIPPADIRPMIDKTAQYVARHGPSFEAMVLQREQGNPQFAFLEFSNPYRAFFDKRVTDARNALQNGQGLGTHDGEDGQPDPGQAADQEAEAVPEALSFKFAFRAPELTLEQSQLMKLAAFYVSVRGDEYLDRLSLRFGEDPRFGFLKTSHPHFLYFTHLVDSYAGVRQMGTPELQRLVAAVQDKMSVVDRCVRRLKSESEEATEKRRLVAETNEMQNEFEFDWNNFVIVETVDLDPDQFRTGTTDARGQFHGVDPKNYLGKRGINPEFAFLAEGLKKKKEAVAGPEESAGPSEDPPEPRRVTFAPTESSEHYVCGFCRQTIPLALFESHNKSELLAAERQKTAVYKPQEFGTVDYLAHLNNTLAGPRDAPPPRGDPAELQKPKLLRRQAP